MQQSDGAAGGAGDGAAKAIREYLEELDRAGVGPREFADYVKRTFDAGDPAHRSTDNFPGFAYVQRVISAVGRAATSQAEEMNEAWSEMRSGRYEFGSAVRTWTGLIERSFGVMAALMEGPFYSPRPAWLVIPYSKGTPASNRTPDRTFPVTIEGAPEPDAELDYTEFVGLTERSPVPIYNEPPRRVGTRVEVCLRDKAIGELRSDTDYVSFIFRKGQGAAAPLVIVLLRVKD